MQHMSLLMATKRKVWVPSLQDRHKYEDIQLMNALRNDDLITDGQHLNSFLNSFVTFGCRIFTSKY